MPCSFRAEPLSLRHEVLKQNATTAHKGCHHNAFPMSPCRRYATFERAEIRNKIPILFGCSFDLRYICSVTSVARHILGSV
jgi:hypothetical protein